MRAISGARRFVAWLAITKIFRARTDAHAGYRAKKMHVRPPTAGAVGALQTHVQEIRWCRSERYYLVITACHSEIARYDKGAAFTKL